MQLGCKRTDFYKTVGGTDQLFTARRNAVVKNLEVCNVNTQCITILPRLVDASNFASLQQAIQCSTLCDIACVEIQIPAGVYHENISLDVISDAKITLCGPSEDQYSRGYQHDMEIQGPTAFGSGVATLSTVGNVISIVTSGDPPNLLSLNINNGDCILVYDDSGTISKRTIVSVTANTIMLTSSVTLGTLEGAGFVFLPAVHIVGSINTAAHTGKLLLKTIYVRGTGAGAVSSTTAPVCLENSTLFSSDAEGALGALSLSGAAIPRSDLRRSALFGSRNLSVARIHGIEAQNMMYFVQLSVQPGYAVLADEGTYMYIEQSQFAGQPTGPLIRSENASYLQLEQVDLVVNRQSYTDSLILADNNGNVRLQGESSVLIAPSVTAGTGSAGSTARNASKLLVCGPTITYQNLDIGVLGENQGMVVADEASITFVAGSVTEFYCADPLIPSGSCGPTLPQPPLLVTDLNTKLTAKV